MGSVSTAQTHMLPRIIATWEAVSGGALDDRLVRWLCSRMRTPNAVQVQSENPSRLHGTVRRGSAGHRGRDASRETSSACGRGAAWGLEAVDMRTLPKAISCQQATRYRDIPDPRKLRHAR